MTWQVASLFRPWEGDRASYLTAVRMAFNESVQRSLAGAHHLGVALSGGLDSRAISERDRLHAAPSLDLYVGRAGLRR